MHATSRDVSSLAGLVRQGAVALPLDLPVGIEALRSLPSGIRVLHSVPTTADRDFTAELLSLLRPSRVVYLSTTGVYGDAREVDETTRVSPRTQRQRLRVDAETIVQRGPFSSLILRPAAIYGPGRGVHVSMRAGRYRLIGDGTNYVSRIHVDDLAALAEAALLLEATGAYPVADDEPCQALEMARFCAKLLRIEMPPSVPPEATDETLRANRRVDGRAIRELLGVTLVYPSYRAGVPASL